MARRNIQSGSRKDSTDLERLEETIRIQITEDLLECNFIPLNISTLIIVMTDQSVWLNSSSMFQYVIKTLFQRDNKSLIMEEVAYETLYREDKLMSGYSKLI